MSKSTSKHSQLRDILAELYSREADARRIVQDAGMKPSRVAWDATPVNTWHNILQEAERQGLVEAILAIAYQEYPNPEIWAKVDASDAPQAGPVVHTPSPHQISDLRQSLQSGKEEYAALTAKIEQTVRTSDRSRLQRQLEQLEDDIASLEYQLSQMEYERDQQSLSPTL